MDGAHASILPKPHIKHCTDAPATQTASDGSSRRKVITFTEFIGPQARAYQGFRYSTLHHSREGVDILLWEGVMVEGIVILPSSGLSNAAWRIIL